jgi:hypothetical protein
MNLLITALIRLGLLKEDLDYHLTRASLVGHRNHHHHPVHAGRLGRICRRFSRHGGQRAVPHEGRRPLRRIALPSEAGRRKNRSIGAADRARPGAWGAEGDAVRSGTLVLFAIASMTISPAAVGMAQTPIGDAPFGSTWRKRPALED